ncbi:MAG: hypothetical protein ACPGJV_02700 [Bacteriovoracaceae bacterium]
MGSNVKLKVNLPNYHHMITEVRNEFSKTAPEKIRIAYLSDLNAGVSPVKGKGKFKTYSSSYRNQISKMKGKRTGVVDFYSTGQFYRSFMVKAKNNIGSSLKLIFEFAEYTTKNGKKISLAKIHNELGAGKKKIIRRLLPKKKEKFSDDIMEVVEDELKDAVTKIVAKYNSKGSA